MTTSFCGVCGAADATGARRDCQTADGAHIRCRPGSFGREEMAELTAAQRHHPRTRSRQARADVLCARRNHQRGSDGDVEIRRLRVRDGAPAVGRPAAARLPAIHAQPRADRQGRLRGAGRDADGARPGERRRDGAVARQAGARHGLLRHRVSAYLDRRGSRQRRGRLPLSAARAMRRFFTPPASAATARPRRRVIGG